MVHLKINFRDITGTYRPYSVVNVRPKNEKRELKQKQSTKWIGMQSDFQFKMICRAISIIKIYAQLKHVMVDNSINYLLA